MQGKDIKEKNNNSDYDVVRVDLVGEQSDFKLFSYEVIDAKKETVGRFGSFGEAQQFLTLLQHID